MQKTKKIKGNKIIIMKHTVITFLALYTTIKLCKISAENYKLKRQLQEQESAAKSIIKILVANNTMLL